MTAKHPRRCEFAQLVADHVLRHEQLDELPSVVHHERVPDEVRHDRAIARPRLERLATACALLTLDLTQQALADVRSLLDRTAHLHVLRRSQFLLCRRPFATSGVCGIGFQSCRYAAGLESYPTAINSARNAVPAGAGE